MHISARSLATAAWCAFAASTVHAQYIVEGLSFGHKPGSISPNSGTIPGWHTFGEGHTPDMLSDRVILTPPYPGNKRGALWSDNPLPHREWVIDLEFRASGPERGGGNLQVWYAKDGPSTVELSSLYTVPKFDGLVLALDQHGGRGGSIRGFLNDGSISYKDHHNVDTLSFGICDYAYRNRGDPTKLRLQQTSHGFEVLVDGRSCIKSDKITLPPGYHFGISAASAESPDSFEINKFVVSTTNSISREEIHRVPQNQPHQQSQQQARADQQQHEQAPLAEALRDIPDAPASSYRSVEDQFGDLHNRLQSAAHQVNNVYRELSMLRKNHESQMVKLEQTAEQRHRELADRTRAANEKVAAMERTIQKIEGIVVRIQKDVEGKDYKEHFTSLQNTLKDTHLSLSEGIPAAMSQSE
ncbi:hypothetical protein H2201_007274 [Coniosporium apollinis]|uniref:L-type lectin-like domain-containing protein n=1 Tax=Coniosporium apollinis TaxID=61459 RepID=A0ABQ9NK97_9PEZI|nr:hypothetical protein H2201_007274 [Coniosporium apollinis]